MMNCDICSESIPNEDERKMVACDYLFPTPRNVCRKCFVKYNGRFTLDDLRNLRASVKDKRIYEVE